GFLTVVGASAPGAPGVYNLLVGAGGDYLAGGFGRRNLLVGGGSTSTLVGADGEDLLIGGTTRYDTPAGLTNWRADAADRAGSGDPFATRVSNVESGTGVPALNTSTVAGHGGGYAFLGNGGTALIYTDGLDTTSGFGSVTTFTIAP